MYRTIMIALSILVVAFSIHSFIAGSELSTNLTLLLSALVFLTLGIENIQSKQWISGLLFICTSMLVLGVAIQLIL